jgi:CheY-like chemotaxis protein
LLSRARKISSSTEKFSVNLRIPSPLPPAILLSEFVSIEEKTELGMKILLVDDSAAVRRLLKSMLADIADEIYECGDGDEAFELYVAHLPDWVLMDVFMKKTDGLTALETIKKIYPRARIIVVTNHTDKRTRRAAFDAGADGFYGKDDLLALVSHLKTEKMNSARD